jgi:hypothetical protein
VTVHQRGDGEGDDDDVVPVGMRSRRAWNRLQRRLSLPTRGEQLQLLSGLAAVSTPVFGLQVGTGHPLGMVGMRVPGWTLTLVGIAPGLDDCLGKAVLRPSPWSLTGAGRYGHSWWLVLAAGEGQVTVLAARLHLARAGGDTVDRFGQRRPVEIDIDPVDRGREWMLAGEKRQH